MYSSHNQPEGPSWADLSLMVFRSGIAIVLAAFQLIPELRNGWATVWQEKPWPLVDLVAGVGVPQMKWIVAAAVVLESLSLLALALGFLTRISAALLLSGVVFVGVETARAGNAHGFELTVVYGLSLSFLLLRGPGQISADEFFSERHAE